MISTQLNWDPFLSRLRLRALPRNFSLSPKNPTPALQAIIWGLKKYSFCNPYDLFTICAIRRSVDYKQVQLCFVLLTGIQRTLTSNPDQGHGSIPIGSWGSSCFSEKYFNSCEADVDRVWDEGEALGDGETPQEKYRHTLLLAFIGVKNCRSRPHLWCAGLKARSTPAESKDCVKSKQTNRKNRLG